MAAVTTGNIVAALGRGLLPIADLVAALSSGLFAIIAPDTGVAVCVTGADRSVVTMIGSDRSVTTITVDLEC